MLDSLRSRLVLSNLLISLSGLLIAVVVFVFVLGNRMTDVKLRDRQEQARNIATQVQRIYGQHGKPGELVQLVTSASRLLRARVIIVRPDGVPVQDSATKTPYYTGSWQPDPKALEAGRAAQGKARSGDVVPFQEPIVGTHRRIGGAVLLVVRSAEVRPTLQSLAGILFILAGTAFLVWLLIALFFAFSISRPLLRITDATEEMARGHYGARVQIDGGGEIARLGASFDAMAEQIQRTNQVLRDFVANVSHDLRTPLTMVSGFSQAILDGTAGPHETEESALVIHEEATKMQRLVEDLLQLTRLESGLFELDRRPVELFPLIEQMLDRVARSASPEELPELCNAVPPDLAPAHVDPVQIERAIRNLLDNAVQYTRSNGSVTVGARSLGPGWIEMNVSDTGVGIPPEDLPRIFERFYRSDKSRERGHGHSGLGLAIVREIVETHGGQVTVDSEQGSGTVFRVTLPASRDRIVRPSERQSASVR